MIASQECCPACGGLLPPGRTDGLCPKCLLEQGLQTSPPTMAPTQSSDRGGLPAFVALSPEELAPYFPQLQILELLGVGGMGAVYKARQATLDRVVALKVLPTEVGRDPAFVERFTREARALARLNHPHIVTIHDIGQTSGLCYIIMEFIDGANLRQMIHAQSLSPQQALALVPQLCEALQYAHDEGIVHRDIKPENILVDKRGRAKVADFGLAKMLGDQIVTSSLTATQQVMGTLRYMAPEQMLGARDIDHRADLYALGVVFYELLTGDLPLGRFPLPSERAQCDARLDEVVLKALERERERRYQQASEIKTDVETISGSYQPPKAAVVKAPEAPQKLSEQQFEQAADDVRAPAIGLIVMSVLQLLIVLGTIAAVSTMVATTIPGSTSMHRQVSPIGLGFMELVLLASLPLSAIVLVGAIQMKRLRSYEFSLICSILWLLPLGPTCVFTFPLGLWSLLVLLRPQVRAAFRMPQSERPEAWQNRDAELLSAQDTDPPARERAIERVKGRVRSAGIALLVMSGIDLLCIALLGVVIGTQSRGGPPLPVMIALFGVPLVVVAATVFGAIGMLQTRRWYAAMASAVVCILPLTPTWMIRWIVGVYALVVLLRRDVGKLFELHSRTSPESKPQVSGAATYDPLGSQVSRTQASERSWLSSVAWSPQDETMWLAMAVGVALLASVPLVYQAVGTSAGLVLGVLSGLTLAVTIPLSAIRTARQNAAYYRATGRLATYEPWDAWWRDRSDAFRQAISSGAMLGYLLCLVLFMSCFWEGRSTGGDHTKTEVQKTTVGLPTPWLTIEHTAGELVSRRTQTVELVSWSMLYGMLAIALSELVATLRGWEKRDRKASNQTRAVLSGVALVMGLLVAAMVGLSLRS